MLGGYRCPPGGEAPGRSNTIEYCLGQCSNPCVAPPLLAAMYKADTENYHNDASYLSASMLADSNGCARKTLWERTETFYDMPRKRFWAFRGAIGHALCEGAEALIAPYGWLQEIRTEVALTYDEFPAPIFDDNGVFTGDFDHTKPLVIKIKGTADAYNPYLRKLADMKSMADKKAMMTINGTKSGTYSPNLQDEHVWQFNIYRWLLSKTPIPEWVREHYAKLGLPPLTNKHFPAPRELIMQGFSMMELPRSGSTYGVEKYGKVTLHDIDPVPVFKLADIEAFVREKALFWHRHLVLKLPAPVVPESKKWLCNYCAFNGELIEGERCRPNAERRELSLRAATEDNQAIALDDDSAVQP